MTAPNTNINQTSTGLAPNVGGALAYALGPISGVAFIVMEKENRFIRFHAAQSIVVFLAAFALSIVVSMLGSVLAFIPLVGWLVASVLSLTLSVATFGAWLFLMWKAWQGEAWRAPVAADLAERIAG
jgi:uncharacterized membrane protein